MKKLLTLTVVLSALAVGSAHAADGKALYEKSCANGKGETTMGKRLGAKDYTDPKVQDALKDDDAIKAVKEGFKDKEGKTLMKPVEDLSADDIKALVAYMRSFKK